MYYMLVIPKSKIRKDSLGEHH